MPNNNAHATAHTATTQGSMRILLRLPNWLGDSVMASPAFEWLKSAYPSATFTLVGSKAACGIYERDIRVGRIIIDESKRGKGLSGFLARLRGISHLAHNVGAHDISIAFTNNFFSALFLYLTKSPVRIGYARECRSPLLTHALELKKSLPSQNGEKKLHQVQLYLCLITPLAEIKELYRIYTQAQHYSQKSNEKKAKPTLLEFLSTQDLCLKVGDKGLIPCHNASQNVANAPCEVLSRANELPSPPKALRIGINPGAAFGSAKRWEQSHFIACVEYFLSHGHEVYLFGSSGESEANTAIAQAISSHANAQLFCDLTDRTSLSSLIDTISALSVFITNDSGPMHIASALKVPLVAIFGPTDLGETAPYSPDSEHSESKPQVLLYKALPCSPCKKRECPLKEPEYHQCMRAITPSEVIKAALSLAHTPDSEISESSNPYKGNI